MLDPYDSSLEFYVEVIVDNPRLEPEGFISYEIAIETNNLSFSRQRSTVRRRYSDFVSLRKLLSKEFPAMRTPCLPPKSLFQNHYHPSFIRKRRLSLEEFVKNIVSQKMYLSSKALHLFLQSDCSMSEIKDIIQGKNVPVESSNEIHNNGLSCFYSSYSLDENNGPSSSGPAELEISSNSVPNVSKISDVLPNVMEKCDVHSPAGNKRVSFCEQVIVAQIHVD